MTYVALLLNSVMTTGLEVTTVHVAPRLMEYSTLVMAEPFELPSVKGTFSVRLSEVLTVPIAGGLGTLTVDAMRVTFGPNTSD
jgi:hypothetical protein